VMDDDSFKFFVDQVIRQYQELKTDIRADFLELKVDLKNHQLEFEKRHQQLEKRISRLESFKSYIAGVAGISIIIAEVAGRVIEHYFR